MWSGVTSEPTQTLTPPMNEASQEHLSKVHKYPKNHAAKPAKQQTQTSLQAPAI